MSEKKENRMVISESFNLFNFNRADIGTPKVEEAFGREPWIKYGANNDYPQELLRIFQNSDGLHSAIIRRKVDMVAGLGFMESLPLKDFIANTYGKENLNKVVYKCAFDLVLFGGYYLNIIWDAKGKSIAKVFHVPFEKVRVAKPTREDGEVSEYYISRDWLKTKKQENIPYPVAAFDIEDEQKRISEPSQLYFCKMYSPGMDYYTLPGYHSIVNWLKLSYEISTYHLKSAQNAYMPGLIVSIPSVPTPQEREKTAQEIKARSGTDEAGKTIVVYGESKDNMPEFTVLQPSNSDQKFNQLMQQINEEIYIGHAANNVIAGVAVAGRLGNQTETKEQFSIFQKTVIAPLQNELESSFEKIATINGITEPIKLKKYTDYIDGDDIAPTATPTTGPSSPATPSAEVEQPAQT